MGNAVAPEVHPTRLLAISVSPERCWPLAVSGNNVWTPAMPVDTAEVIARPSRFVRSILTSSARLLPNAGVTVGGSPSKAVDVLERALRSRTGLRVWRFGRDLPSRIKVMLKPAADWRDDIRLQALGALWWDHPRPWIIVDSEQVLTISSVRPSRGKHLGVLEGVLMLPGEVLALDQVRPHASRQLCLFPWTPKLKTDLPALGRSLEEAIRLGARWSQVPAIVAIVKAQAERLGPRTRVMLTGRGLNHIYKDMRVLLKRYKPDEDFSLDAMGLLAAWEHAHGPLSPKA